MHCDGYWFFTASLISRLAAGKANRWRFFDENFRLSVSLYSPCSAAGSWLEVLIAGSCYQPSRETIGVVKQQRIFVAN